MNIEEYKEKLNNNNNKSIINDLESEKILNVSGKENIKNNLYEIEKKKEKLNSLLKVYEQIVSMSNEVQEYEKQIEQLKITLNSLNQDESDNKIEEINNDINVLKNKIIELEDEMKILSDNC